MKRRLLTLRAISALAASTGMAGAQESPSVGSNERLRNSSNGDLAAALRAYRALPGTKSYLIHVGPGGSLGRVAHRPHLSLFTASAYKTFVLGQYLRDVEAGTLSEDEQLAIDDSVRTIGSPVFQNLAGSTQARSVLDAMLAYSDNTATDLATGKVSGDKVRALIAQLGLSSIRIPDSTRRLFSYIFGAPAGVDLGWPVVRGTLSPGTSKRFRARSSPSQKRREHSSAISPSPYRSRRRRPQTASLRKRRGIARARRLHIQRQELRRANGRQQW
jgi:beta-lactamase class A